MSRRLGGAPLRLRWLWWSLGVLLVVGVCVGSLLPGEIVIVPLSVGDKWLHAGSYLLLMVWFGGIYHTRRHLAVAGVLFALGLVLDILQGTVRSRTFDLLDVAANAVGILVGLVLARSLLAGWCHRVERLILA